MVIFLGLKRCALVTQIYPETSTIRPAILSHVTDMTGRQTKVAKLARSASGGKTRKDGNCEALHCEALHCEALQFEGLPTSHQSFWVLITRPIMHQPTNSTLPQPTLDSLIPMSSQIRIFFGDWLVSTGIFGHIFTAHEQMLVPSFWSKF